MEKIAVAVVVNSQTAERIQKEVIRQNFVEEFDNLYRRMREAGFRLEIVGTPDPNFTMFGNKIQVPASYFVNRKINEYNMQVIY